MECNPEAINQLLEQLKSLSEEEKREIENIVEYRKMNKFDFLIKEGQISDEIFFVDSGILRSYHITPEGEEITNAFAMGGEFFGAFYSFYGNVPTDENIQAVEETKVRVIRKKDMEDLYKRDAKWQELGRELIKVLFIEMQWKVSSFQRLSARQRYEQLMDACPSYVQMIPQRYLASYIGITPRHLTRLRGEIRF